jgi:hypothetical protein
MTTCWPSSSASDNYADSRRAQQHQKPAPTTRRQRSEQRVRIVPASAQFVYALLGADYDKSPYTQTGERIARLAAGGIRLVVGDLRTDVTKTRKDGSRGRLRIDYGDARDPQAAVAWLWKFVDGAKTAGELYGRALVVIAAEQYATRLVVPASQRMPATRWSSHKDLAANALRKLAGPHLPASLTKLEQAVKRAHTAYDKAERAQREHRQAAPGEEPEAA